MRQERLETHIKNLLTNAELLPGQTVKISPVKIDPAQLDDKDVVPLPSVQYKRNTAPQDLQIDDEDVGDAFSFTIYMNALTYEEVIDMEQVIKGLFVTRNEVETDEGPIQFNGTLSIFAMGEDYITTTEYYVRSCEMSGTY